MRSWIIYRQTESLKMVLKILAYCKKIYGTSWSNCRIFTLRTWICIDQRMEYIDYLLRFFHGFSWDGKLVFLSKKLSSLMQFLCHSVFFPCVFIHTYSFRWIDLCKNIRDAVRGWVRVSESSVKFLRHKDAIKEEIWWSINYGKSRII